MPTRTETTQGTQEPTDSVPQKPRWDNFNNKIKKIILDYSTIY